MASTKKTTNYKLSQYQATDRPSYLTDYNADMTAIDTQMKANATAAANAQTTANTAKSTADTAKSTAEAAKSSADGKMTQSTADGRYAPKSATAPATTGLTAAQYDALYVDDNNIVRVKPASN